MPELPRRLLRRLHHHLRHPSRAGIAQVASLGLLCLLVLVALMGWLDSLRIDTTQLSALLGLTTLALMVLAFVRRSPRWWLTRMSPLTMVAVATVSYIAWYVRASRTISDKYPPSFLFWFAVTIVTIGAALVGWHSASSRQRLASIWAVPISVAAVFVVINAHYGYFPTLGDLLGHPVTGQVSVATLQHELALAPDPAPPVRDVRSPSPAPVRPREPGIAVRVGRHASNDRGQFVQIDFPATVSHFSHRRGGVYLPPAYFTPARDTLPVLIMLAGTPSGPSTLATAGGAIATANAYAAAHGGVAPVMLFPDANGTWTGDTECVNGPRGQAETYLTVDVVNFATSVLHLTPDGRRWGIVGFSEGGTCAIDLALRHANQFAAFVDLAGDAAPNVPGSTLDGLYGGNEQAMTAHDPAWLLSHYRYPGTSAWFGSGHRDTTHLAIGQQLASEARAAGAQAWWFSGPGGHGFQFCTWAIKHLMPPLMNDLDPGGTTLAGV